MRFKIQISNRNKLKAGQNNLMCAFVFIFWQMESNMYTSIYYAGARPFAGRCSRAACIILGGPLHPAPASQCKHHACDATQEQAHDGRQRNYSSYFPLHDRYSCRGLSQQNASGRMQTLIRTWWRKNASGIEWMCVVIEQVRTMLLEADGWIYKTDRNYLFVPFFILLCACFLFLLPNPPLPI